MKKEKISLSLINRNDSLLLARLIDEAKYWVDEIVVADTGSTDDSVPIAREMGAKVIDASHLYNEEEGFLTNFSKARNISLEACRNDYIIVLDTDDSFNGWRSLGHHMEKMGKDSSIGSCTAEYHYTWVDGTMSVKLPRQVFFHRDRAGWTSDPVHEVVKAHDGFRLMPIDGVITHLSDGARGVGADERNLKILENWERELGDDANDVTRQRIDFYIADSVMSADPKRAAERFDRAIDNGPREHLYQVALYKRAICEPTEERMFNKIRELVTEHELAGADLYLLAAHAHIKSGNMDEARKWRDRAVGKKTNEFPIGAFKWIKWKLEE